MYVIPNVLQSHVTYYFLQYDMTWTKSSSSDLPLLNNGVYSHIAKRKWQKKKKSLTNTHFEFFNATVSTKGTFFLRQSRDSDKLLSRDTRKSSGGLIRKKKYSQFKLHSNIFSHLQGLE